MRARKSRGVQLYNKKLLRDVRELGHIQQELSQELIDLTELDIMISRLTILSETLSNRRLRSSCNELITKANQLKRILTPQAADKKEEEYKITFSRTGISQLPSAVKSGILLPFLDAKSRASLSVTNSIEKKIIDNEPLLDPIIFLPNHKVMQLTSFKRKPTLCQLNKAVKKGYSGMRLFGLHERKIKLLPAYLREIIGESKEGIVPTKK